MPKVVPSQIVEFIDKRYPVAKEQLSGQGKPFSIDYGRQGIVNTIMHLIDQLPTNLMPLAGDEFVRFLEAYHELKSGVAIWSTGSGGLSHEITKIKDGSGLNPITVIRDILSKCPDQGFENRDTGLSFIADQIFAEIINQDISFVNEALSNAEWKASTVLAGSVIEAVLLYSIKGHRERNPTSYERALEKTMEEQAIGKPLARKPSGNPDGWNLNHYIYVAFAAELISENTAKECLLSKDYRNLIHQGAAERKKQRCDRGTAHLAIAAMEHVINDLKRQCA
jgi:hypothetical protein